MHKLIEDCFYKLGGLEQLNASISCVEKSVKQSSSPRFCIVVWNSAFVPDEFYLKALRYAFSYNDDIAINTLHGIKESGEEGYIVYTGRYEITEHRVR